jgi:transcriptional regulator with XRE-family HTH domain
MKETFGEYIHNLRTEASLTLTKLAAALDIDQSTLSKIENGKRNVTEEILPKLADIFDLDIDQLEKEYFSEKIAEQKAEYKKLINLKQGKIDFKNA